MHAILIVFMTQHLLASNGSTNDMTIDKTKGWFQLFLSAVYFTPHILCTAL